ncbi:MAG: PilZ domain-containing protein [Candidatus Omnitrophica bacterium]|nr:PilZ domain-containing protein [Candidatus Omnitrophota bacterium]MBI5143531.1 PilZ domain-containing protein [Candidatus Omnitrophota bacterium]
MATEERRGYPRIQDEGLSLKLKLGDFDAVTHTLNLSASGVYCKVDKEIPLMSRVKLILMVPDSSKEGGTTRSLEVLGVVVREHPVIIDGKTKHYDVAIFFEDLSDKDREIISNYIVRKK